MEGDENLERPAADTPSTPVEKEDKSSGTETEVETEESAEAETEETADEADGEEGDTDDSDDDAEDDKPKKPKRISHNERVRRQNERLRREVEELRSRPAVGSQSTDDIAREVERQIGPPPKEGDFKGDYLAFERAKTVYELDHTQTTREVKKQAISQETARLNHLRELVDEHQDRVEEFKERTPDFDQSLKAAHDKGLKINPTAEQLILKSKKSAHIVYVLSKNEDIVHELNAMSDPLDIAIRIGELSAKLSLPSPKTQTQARKPVVPLKGGAVLSSSESAQVAQAMARLYPGRKF